MVSREPPVEIIVGYNPNDPLSCRLKALHEFSRVDDYDSIIWEHGYLVVAGVLETIADTDEDPFASEFAGNMARSLRERGNFSDAFDASIRTEAILY